MDELAPHVPTPPPATNQIHSWEAGGGWGKGGVGAQVLMLHCLIETGIKILYLQHTLFHKHNF